MKMIFTRLCYLTFLFFAVPSMAAPELICIPKQFHAYIGGFMGLSYNVELRGGRITYSVFEGHSSKPNATTITPTAAQWCEFRQALDGLKIWHWLGDYPSQGVMDGTQWSLDIVYADRVLKTKGDNNYPDDTGKPNGKPEPTSTFNCYLAAVKKLLGGENFQ